MKQKVLKEMRWYKIIILHWNIAFSPYLVLLWTEIKILKVLIVKNVIGSHFDSQVVREFVFQRGRSCSMPGGVTFVIGSLNFMRVLLLLANTCSFLRYVQLQKLIHYAWIYSTAGLVSMLIYHLKAQFCYCYLACFKPFVFAAFLCSLTVH